MSKRKAPSVPGIIDELLKGSGSVSSGEVARAAGVTRQAAHYHLRRLADEGMLRRTGAGRGARYEPVLDLLRTYPLPGVREELIWREVLQQVPALAAPEAALRVNRFAFTEMLNNANDHSSGSEVEIGLSTAPRFSFRISDDGVGVFRHLATRLGLPDEAAAAFELMKGKRSTAPDEHTGQGIFFTSRLVNRFGLEANAMRLMVDNDIGDFAIGSSAVEVGTTVWWEVDPVAPRDIARVFDAFTDEDLAFRKTRIPLQALGGPSFISRDEAKRVTDELERFEEVLLDFAGVTEVGWAFVDEVFRVWGSKHPGTRLIPVSMSPLVERMVRAGGWAGPVPGEGHPT
jgi:DNA-binding Lrp family transcriptional regulator